jgi:ribosome-binding factor A
MSRVRRPAGASAHRYPRTARLNESLREVIAEDLTRIDDERLALVTITAIDVDPEMNRAIVFFDSLVGEDGDEEILAAFADHRVRLQGSVGRQIRAKKTPILSFRPDQSIRAAERIERILHDEATLPTRPEPTADSDA